MKSKYLILTAIVLICVILSGCSKETAQDTENSKDTSDAETEVVIEKSVEDISEGVVEDTADGNVVLDTQEDEDDESTEEEEEESSDESVEESTEDSSESQENETSSETTETKHEIVIENFAGTPANLDIKVGDTVVWNNQMQTVNPITILAEKDGGGYEQRGINEPLVRTLPMETYEYTFEQAGKFKWGSLTKFNLCYGIITVTE